MVDTSSENVAWFVKNIGDTEVASLIEALAAERDAALSNSPVWRSMDSAPKDGTQFLSMQDDWGPFVTWRDDTRNYPWRFLDRDNEINGFRDGEHGPTHWRPLPSAPGTQPDPVAEAAQINPGAIEALSAYQQADQEGIMVLVSRQAIEECLPALRSLAAKGGE